MMCRFNSQKEFMAEVSDVVSLPFGSATRLTIVSPAALPSLQLLSDVPDTSCRRSTPSNQPSPHVRLTHRAVRARFLRYTSATSSNELLFLLQHLVLSFSLRC